MKAALPNPNLKNAVITANVSTGFRPVTKDGKPLRLALVDETGNIVESGEDVAWTAWYVCVEVQENFWNGQGHLVVRREAPSEKLLVRTAA
ncbi:hypothetical protein N7414_23035 [Pseudomonas sp. GD04087]|uniref:hypothetical protein n=1 Tax=unclassified Pseudomonas TaxID=196821 RepID=UPI00244CCD80|nr:MULTISPECIES: hypothetical protein [unclassified Pseudomonas]MDH0292010.1 hypothetical protein [Pseudomonas sp. GD04087]MDH1052858.1 hypothetical protein [Pseudomonas sp. GD03903]MDH2002021.1 hypothetical protein [Pseudomonas sp. GD03691]